VRERRSRSQPVANDTNRTGVAGASALIDNRELQQAGGRDRSGAMMRWLFGPRDVAGGRVQIWGCSPGCLLASLLVSIVLTILLNLLLRWIF